MKFKKMHWALAWLGVSSLSIPVYAEVVISAVSITRITLSYSTTVAWRWISMAGLCSMPAPRVLATFLPTV